MFVKIQSQNNNIYLCYSFLLLNRRLFKLLTSSMDTLLSSSLCDVNMAELITWLRYDNFSSVVLPGNRLPGWQERPESRDALEHQSPEAPVVDGDRVPLPLYELGGLKEVKEKASSFS